MLTRAAVLISAVTVLVTTCLLTSQVYGLGLGKVTLESSLNQPLRARIELLQLGDVEIDEINVQLASVDDFRRFNIDRALFLGNIKFQLEAQGNQNFLLLSSNQLVKEPYLNFILDTRWPSGRLLSEHTLLLDLPVFDDDRKAPAVRQAVLQEANPISQSSTAASSTATAATTIPVQATTRPTINNVAPESQSIPAPAPTAAPVPPAPAPAVPVPPAPAIVNEVERSAAPQAVQTERLAAAVAAEEVQQEIPDSNDNVDRTPALTASDTIETGVTDTLWEIAQRVRPDNSVSIQQTMLAIQRLNPDAFANNNINRLLAGEELLIPDLSEIRSIDQQQAVAEVSRQNGQPRVGAQPLNAPATGPATQPSTGRQGQLSVLSTDVETVDTSASGAGPQAEQLDARITELENRLALRSEEADRVNIENSELNSRLADLEAQIASAQEIINLRDLQLAQYQESLTLDNAPVSAESETATQAETGESETTAIVAALPEAQPRTLLETIISLLTGNSIILAAIALVLILVMVLLLVRRRREDEFEDNLVAEGLIDSDSRLLSANAKIENDDDSGFRGLDKDQQSQFDDLLDLGEDYKDSLDDYADDDLLEQVSVFIEFDQYDEAARLLNEALIQDPENEELQLKLLEIHAMQDDPRSFETLAANMSVLADNELQEQIEALRKKLPSEYEPEIPVNVKESNVSNFDDENDLITFGGELDSISADVDLETDELDDLDVKLADFAELEFDDKESFDSEEAEVSVEQKEQIHAGETSEGKLSDKLDLSSALDEIEELDFDLDYELDPTTGDSESNSRNAELDLETISFDEDKVDDDDDEIIELENENKTPGDDETESVEFDLEEDVLSDGSKSDLTTGDDLISDDDLDDFDFDLENLDSKTVFETSEESNNTAVTSSKDSQGGDTKSDTTSDVKDATGNSSAEGSEVESIDISNVDGNDFDFDLDEFEIDDDDEYQTFSRDSSKAEPENENELDDSRVAGGSSTQPTQGPFETNKDAATTDDELDALEFSLTDDDLVDLDDDDFEELEVLSDDDEAATKLELAYAYQKMGDYDGAREILQEVIDEGTDEQGLEAKNLLASLDKQAG